MEWLIDLNASPNKKGHGSSLCDGMPTMTKCHAALLGHELWANSVPLCKSFTHFAVFLRLREPAQLSLPCLTQSTALDPWYLSPHFVFADQCGGAHCPVLPGKDFSSA